MATANGSSPAYVYSIASEMSSSSTTVASLAIIKRPQPLDPTIPLHSQLQIMNLPGTVVLNSGAQGSVSPFEILHSMVHLALGPYFDAYTKGQETQSHGRTNRFADGEAKTGIPVTKKKLAELELSLLHLQQNIEIPELSLALHHVVQAAVDEVESYLHRRYIYHLLTRCIGACPKFSTFSGTCSSNPSFRQHFPQ